MGDGSTVSHRAAASATVLVTAVYPRQVAATRLRAMQYADHLAAEGLRLDVWSLIADDDVADWFGGRTRRRIQILLRGLLRLVALARQVRRADVAVVQREVLPFGPPVIERLIARRRPVVWDVDDAIWESYPGLFLSWMPDFVRKTGRKYERVCALATEVWAGSEVLASWCRQHNQATHVIPTVVDVPRDAPDAGKGTVVGWIGSPTTGPFMAAIVPALSGLPAGTEVVCMGADVPSANGMPVRSVPWSPDGETALLERMAVGLYPIDPEHPLADGKCGLKAILYMSHGIPSVVTPTPTNAVVVRDEVDGLHAHTLDEWHTAVKRLLEDPELRQRLGTAAHERARENYSLWRWGPVVASKLRRLTTS